MPILRRDFLDTVLPDDEITRRLAERLSGLDLSEDLLGRGLRWMAKVQEDDRFTGFTGTTDPLETWWTLNTSGLTYKGSESYLTSEGWPLGTCCWCVQVECGSRTAICAETPELAVLRTIIVIHTILQGRAMPRPQRERLDVMLTAARQSAEQA